MIPPVTVFFSTLPLPRAHCRAVGLERRVCVFLRLQRIRAKFWQAPTLLPSVRNPQNEQKWGGSKRRGKGGGQVKKGGEGLGKGGKKQWWRDGLTDDTPFLRGEKSFP